MAAPGNQLTTSRLLPFPPATVYAAFADPATLVRWWGPHGTTTTIHAFDLRPGGAWRLTMRGPWGEATMAKRFTAVEPNRRIAVLHEQEGHTFTLDMRMEPEGNGTLLTWTTTFATADQLAAVREAFAKGNEENLERLATLLNQTVK